MDLSGMRTGGEYRRVLHKLRNSKTRGNSTRSERGMDLSGLRTGGEYRRVLSELRESETCRGMDLPELRTGRESGSFLSELRNAPVELKQEQGEEGKDMNRILFSKIMCAVLSFMMLIILPLGIVTAESGGWTCTSCGLQGNTGNFCANCGAAKPVSEWTCVSCGATGNTGNFCYNCGAARPAAEWTCPNCGQSGNTGSFCPTCGTARNGTAQAPQAPVLTPALTEAPTPTPEPQPTVNPNLEQIPGETGRVKIRLQGVDASQYIKAGDNPNKWVPQNATDGNETTCWQYNGGGGVWLELNTGASEAVDEIWFKNGFWGYNDKGKEQYSINARPKAVTVEFLYSGEGSFRDGESFTLADTWGSDWQRFQVSRRESVTAVRITVNSIYTGSYFKKDVCLSEVMLVQHASASIAGAAQGQQAAVIYESRPEVTGCELLDRLSTRSGPGTVYQEPGTFFRNDTWRGRTVRVLKKSTGDGVWWVQVDFQTDNGNRYRVWTGKKRVDVNLDRVQQEYPIGDCDIASTSDTRWGPGGSYAAANIAIGGNAMGVLYEIDNGWADVEYYSDNGHGRVWIPAECVYNVDTSTDRSGEN